MWNKHLIPKDINAPTVVSTFAGCGGSMLGYSMAGYRELLAVEWDKYAVTTLKNNNSELPIYNGDIRLLSSSECLDIIGLAPGELDVLDGSPPCQGFSNAGKRNIEDNRNMLYLEYTRLLKKIKPKVFVMENVSGLIQGKMKLIFSEIVKELKKAGYKVSVRLLNMCWYSVPQSRERLIFIGIRDDLRDRGNGSIYPTPQFRPVSTKAAIGHLESFGGPDLNPSTRPYWKLL